MRDVAYWWIAIYLAIGIALTTRAATHRVVSSVAENNRILGRSILVSLISTIILILAWVALWPVMATRRRSRR